MRNMMPMANRPAKMIKDAKTASEESRTAVFKSGGSASKRADGCAKRGKTKGQIV